MGGRFSRVQYREQDAAVLPHLLLLTQVWGLEELALLSVRLRRLSFNFCLTREQFAELLALQGNPLFRELLQRWFTTFQNTRSSTVVNGLEILVALALAATDGKLEDKAGAVFDLFDFDDSGAITRDELGLLLKSAVRGLSKATRGLGPRLVALCPMSEVAELARQCFASCDLDDEQDLSRSRFVHWVRHTPKIVNLLRCFVQREFLTRDEAALELQRCTRGMLARRDAAERRLELQFEVEQELSQAAQRIQDVVVTRKKRRDRLRQQKVEQFAHHGALYSFGANTRAQLGHANMDLSRRLGAPLLAAFFKHSELRVTQAALGEAHACVVTSSGQIFTWGFGVPGAFGFLLPPDAHCGGGVVRKQPTKVADLDDVVMVDARLGCHHSVALSASGAIYTWGSGGYGQLGHGDFSTTGGDTEPSDAVFRSQLDPHTGREYPVIELPLQLDVGYFEEMRVLQVACGYYFTLAVAEDGSVFSWGEGSDGQLGLGYTDAFRVGFLDPHVSGSSFVYMGTPTRIDALKEPIASVAVGGNHVFAVSRPPSRRVFEWGAWKRRGAVDTRESAFSPVENPALSTLAVHHVAAGKEHALAVAARVLFSLRVDQFPYHGRGSTESKDANEDDTLQAVALCARFGAQPAQLSRAVTGAVFAVPLPSPEHAYRSQSGSNASAAALSAAVYDRSDTQLRASLARCTGKVALLGRGTPTGHWLSLLVASSATPGTRPPPPELMEIPCVAAAFGPPLDAAGVCAQLFYSPERLSSLRLYVRPDEVVGRVVVLEFGQEDVAFDAEALEPPELIARLMRSLVALVQDAQEAGAAAVVLIFDFLEADAFALEVDEDEDGALAFDFAIPAVMIRKSQHGELLLEQLQGAGKRPWAILSFKEDVLGKQVLAAQRAGAKAVIVAQTRADPEPTRLGMNVFGGGNDKPTSSSGVKLPVLSIPYQVGTQMRANLEGVEMEDTQGRVELGGAGTLYSWGYGENGRLGLGDIDNEELFQTGYDGARQKSYQFVENPEPVATLLSKKITHVSCGEDHSAAVSSDGELFCWGSGRDGKLGTGSMEDEDTPVAIDALASVRVARVECGASQTFAVTQNPSLGSLHGTSIV